MSRPALLALLLVVMPAPLLAAGCDAAETQAEMNHCAEQAFDAADADLNRLYHQIAARLKSDPPTLKLLVAAQRAWLGFRDAECAFAAAGVSGGSIAPTIVADCKTQATETRNAQLRAYLACKEGDLGCPVPPGP